MTVRLPAVPTCDTCGETRPCRPVPGAGWRCPPCWDSRPPPPLPRWARWGESPGVVDGPQADAHVRAWRAHLAQASIDWSSP